MDGSRVVLLEVGRATSRPVAFQRTEFIRVGSWTRKLRDQSSKERQLWHLLLEYSFEEGIAAEHLTGQDVLQALDYPAYFHLLGVPPADGHDAVLKALAHDRLIKRNQAGGYDITNLGSATRGSRSSTPSASSIRNPVPGTKASRRSCVA